MASYGSGAAQAQAAQQHQEYSERTAYRQQLDGEANPERGNVMSNMGGG